MMKIFDYIVLICLCLLILTFSLVGYPKTKGNEKKRKQNIIGIWVGSFLIITSVTVSFTASAIGNGTGKAAKSIMGLGKKEFAEKIEPVITDAIPAGITTFIKLTEDPNDE